HTVEAEVRALFDRIRAEQGRLDILVNDVWGGDELMEWGKPFWELDPGSGRVVLERAVYSHLLTNRYGAALMIERNAGLIVEVTDGEFLGYRGNLHYDLAKVAAIRLAYAMAAELRGRDVVALAVTPGFLRSEAMLDHFGVTEETWREAVARDRHFAESETPYFLGRGVAALAADPDVRAKSGTVVASWELAKEYGFTDVDGRRPDWGGYFERVVGGILDRGRVADDDERFLLRARYHHIHLDHRRAAEARRIAALLGEA
ncbi:MAG TPA: SDR family NAD(P)-dependent oxidoreductase, partial [Gemmatimonadales bacterium]|nr:SDR family NAD(P)-dependent oxidoreductase [Gemmatimonadales bacterium]